MAVQRLVVMDGAVQVGTLTRRTSGNITFAYEKGWQLRAGATPMSVSNAAVRSGAPRRLVLTHAIRSTRRYRRSPAAGADVTTASR